MFLLSKQTCWKRCRVGKTIVNKRTMLIKGFQSLRLTFGLLLLLVVFIFQAKDSVKAHLNTDTNIEISLELLQHMPRERKTEMEGAQHSLDFCLKAYPFNTAAFWVVAIRFHKEMFNLLLVKDFSFHSIHVWLVHCARLDCTAHTEIFVCFNVNRILYICIDEMNMKHVHKRHDQSISEIKPKLVSFLL